jgi:MbtH protein
MANNPFEDETLNYLVLVNDEEQYSLWPGFRAIPPGWIAVGPKRSRTECLTFINDTWVDMRPKSIRS